MRKPERYLCVIACIAVLCATNVYPQEAVAPPGEVAQKTPKLPADEKVPYVQPGNVTVNFKDADIRAVLNYLSEVGGVDIVPAPDVSGTVTLKLTDKPWNVALDIIVRNYGYVYEREGDIIRVLTVSSLQQEELSTEVIALNYTAVADAQAAVKDMLTERGKLSFDSRTNSLIVTDVAANIYKIKQIIEQLDRRTPQVMIEARIYETLLENDEKMGIDWTIKISAVGATRPTTLPFGNEMWRDVLPSFLERFFPFGQTGTASANVQTGGTVTSSTLAEFPDEGQGGTKLFPYVDADSFTYGTLDFSQFQAVLEILKQRRRTEVVSNPRITTLNNKQAKILVGRVYNFPLFDQAEETGRWVISGYDAKELGIKLLVTPQINKNDEIVVELKPEISNYLGQEKISEELSAPLWSTREAETNVMVRDGDTIFIGGLIRENTVDLEKKIPVLGDLFGDIPLIGGLVKSKSQDKEKTELIFFITVHIVKDLNELARIGTHDMSESLIPDEIAKSMAEKEPLSDKKPFIDLRRESEAKEEKEGENPVPAEKDISLPEKKGHKPLFDWRKKKKK